MKIKNQIFIIALVFFSFALSMHAADYKINANGNSSTVRTERINSIEYAQFHSLTKLIFANSKTLGNSIFFSGNEVKTAVGSFYVLLKNNSDVKVSQMSLPAISLNNSIYVPLESFVSALTSLELIKSDITSAGYFIEPIISNFETASEAEKIIEKPRKSVIEKSNVKINIAKQQEPQNNENEEKATVKIEKKSKAREIKKVVPETEVFQSAPHNNPTIPPNKYYIPESLDRSVIKKLEE